MPMECLMEQWYFVTIIVLTYCEKKLFQCEEKSEKKVCKFEAVRPRICNVFEIFVPHTIEQFFFTVSQKYYGNRLLFRLFLFFPKKKKNNQKFLGYGNNRKYTEKIGNILFDSIQARFWKIPSHKTAIKKFYRDLTFL